MSDTIKLKVGDILKYKYHGANDIVLILGLKDKTAKVASLEAYKFYNINKAWVDWNYNVLHYFEYIDEI